MGSVIAFLIAEGVSPRLARPLAIAALIAALAAMLSLAKCGYDRSLIRNHDAARDVVIAKDDRKADQVVADQRRADDAQITQEAAQLEEVETHANNDTDRRLARHRCLRLQQAARRERRKPPSCS